MKIANIILTSQNGGAEQVFLDYIDVFKKLGHEVLAITKKDAPYADDLEQSGVKVKKISNNFGYHDVFAINNIKRILEESDADAVVAHAGRSMSLVRKALKKIPKKIFFVAVNHSMNVKRSIGADIVFSVNKPIFFNTIDAGQSEESSFVISNSIDVQDAIHALPQNDLSKKSEIIIGVIGRLDDAKGFDNMIKTMKRLAEISDKKFFLRIAGDGAIRDSLQKLAKKLGVEKNVEFLGWVKNKKEFFESIDIFCLPSKKETFGLVLLEAMKYRKPIISSDADGPREILRHDFDSLMFELKPSDDVQNRMAEMILRLVNEPQTYEKLLENSFALLNKKFSRQALEARLREVFGQGS